MKAEPVDGVQPSVMSRLPAAEGRIEQFCNKVAGEMLIPSDDFGQQIAGLPRNAESSQDQLYTNLANRYGISREAILRRLLALNLGIKAKNFAGMEQRIRQGSHGATGNLKC